MFVIKTAKNPVWGDFYSKDGNAGGLGQNALWNTDISLPDSVLDYYSTQAGYKLLVPDSVSTPDPDPDPDTPSVPEPLTVATLMLAAAATGRYVKTRLKTIR